VRSRCVVSSLFFSALLLPAGLSAKEFDAPLNLKVYVKGSGDTADRRLGFTPAPKKKPVRVPAFDLWYVRPIGPLAGAEIHQLADILLESKVPGIDFSNRWDITDETLAILARCTHLRYLNVSRTKVTDTGLEALAELIHLESFVTSQNTTNKGAAYLGGLSRLEELDLDGARVTDTGMNALSSLKRLRSLTLSNTRVTDTGLSALKNLQRLETLVLGSGVSDAGAPLLVGLTGLRSLDASSTNLTDTGWRIIATNPQFRALYMNARVTDAVLPVIGSLHNLQILDLTASRVTDQGLKHLAGATALRELALTRTAVTDAGLEPLSALRSLRVLELSETRVTPAGLQTIARNHPRLEALSFSWPRLGTRELEHLASMKSLKTIILNGTPLPESVTRHLRAMAKLQKDRLRQGPAGPVRIKDSDASATSVARDPALPRRTLSSAAIPAQTQSLASRSPASGGIKGDIAMPSGSRRTAESLYEGHKTVAALPALNKYTDPAAMRNATGAPLSGLRRVRQVEGEGGSLEDIQGPAQARIRSMEYTDENSLGEITIESEPTKPAGKRKRN